MKVSTIQKSFSLLLLNLLICSAEELHLDFFQNDYDVKMDIAECSWYNKTFNKYVNVASVPYNRTQRVMNASFELLTDFNNEIMISVQMYKFTSNEYRFFPVTFKVNACVEYNKNSFRTKDLLLETSNVNPCNLKKNVYYYIRNLMPDVSKYPPHMPRGLYKLSAEFEFRSNLDAQLDLYVRVLDKPIDWKKLPKSKAMH